ncbi:nucleotide disphospho-sugar-binding domain-containing protein [Streptomonospora arabica]|uniref:Nucleotide disphospho-sugar-binding domain-containing protein n=1 Tax=Streptomonospora arabica TaxID=412417 RepID=A0ABV9SHE1_9ACTN
MRVLFNAALQPSHLFPLIPLAWALRAAGHEVRIAHHPSLAPHVQAAGLTSVVVGSDPRLDAGMREHAQAGGASAGDGGGTGDEENRTFHTRMAVAVFAKAAASVVDELVSYAEHWRPDLIVFEWQSYAGHLAGEILGIPTVRHLFPGPDLASGVPEWRRIERQSLEALYREYGVEEVRPDGELTIDPCPPTLGFPAADERRHRPVRFVAYNGTGQVHEWMLEKPSRPRVAVTVGGTYLWMTGHLSPVGRFVDALSTLDAEVIAAIPSGTRELVPEAPDNVRFVENLPLELFLPDCQLIVNHGGVGTVATSLVSGVPQVISPPEAMNYPPFHNAARLTEAGAGARVDENASVERIRETIAEVLRDPSYASAARRISQEAAGRPVPADLVAELEELAGGPGTGKRGRA